MRPDQPILNQPPQELTDEVIFAIMAAQDKQGQMLSMGSGYYIKIDRYEGKYSVQCFSMMKEGQDEGNFERIYLQEGAQIMFQTFARDVLNNGKLGLSMLQKVTGQLLMTMSRFYILPDQNGSASCHPGYHPETATTMHFSTPLFTPKPTPWKLSHLPKRHLK